eukprot:COSAG06_NODE_21448_length_756_cov_1.091324_1_plen_85_part_10
MRARLGFSSRCAGLNAARVGRPPRRFKSPGKKTASVPVGKTRKSPTTVDSTSSRRCVSGNSDTHAAVCAYGGPEEVGLAHPKGLT